MYMYSSMSGTCTDLSRSDDDIFLGLCYSMMSSTQAAIYTKYQDYRMSMISFVVRSSNNMHVEILICCSHDTAWQ